MEETNEFRKVLAEYVAQFQTLRPDEGSELSYELAEELVARDYAQYRSFMHAAHMADGGSKAAQSVLGYSLEDLAAAVLGEGPWTPDPSKWRQGTERGQF